MVSHGEHSDGGGSNGGGGHSDGHVLVIFLFLVFLGGLFRLLDRLLDNGKVVKDNTGTPGPGGVGDVNHSFLFSSDVESIGSNVVEIACHCTGGTGVGHGVAAPVVVCGGSGINGGIASGLALISGGGIARKVL